MACGKKSTQKSTQVNVDAWEKEKQRFEEKPTPPSDGRSNQNPKYELELIDQEPMRPFRATIDGAATEADVQRLKKVRGKCAWFANQAGGTVICRYLTLAQQQEQAEG